MTVADRLGLSLDDPTRVVYVREGAGPSVLDAWEATGRLGPRLATVHELVLLDPVSFPYERLDEAHRDIPVTALLPDRTAQDIVALLGEPLLRHLTPLDVVVASAELLRALDDMRALGPVGRLVVPPGEDPLRVIHDHWRKTRTVACDAVFGLFTGPADDLVTRHVRELGAHQRSDLAMLCAAVRPGDTVLDVGAHAGAFAVPLARTAGAQGRLFAFEANPAVAELLWANLRDNGLERVDVVLAAVSDRSGLPVRSVVGEPGNTGSASVARMWSGTSGGLRTLCLDDWWQEAGRPRVDVVKLDVEGFELRALEGATDLLEAERPAVYVEIAEAQLAANGTSSQAVFRFLQSRGYRFYANGLERNRSDDRFEVRAFNPASDPIRPVEDVLCLVDDERFPQ